MYPKTFKLLILFKRKTIETHPVCRNIINKTRSFIPEILNI